MPSFLVLRDRLVLIRLVKFIHIEPLVRLPLFPVDYRDADMQLQRRVREASLGGTGSSGCPRKLTYLIDLHEDHSIRSRQIHLVSRIDDFSNHVDDLRGLEQFVIPNVVSNSELCGCQTVTRGDCLSYDIPCLLGCDRPPSSPLPPR